jgi:hypothetical protein
MDPRSRPPRPRARVFAGASPGKPAEGLARLDGEAGEECDERPQPFPHGPTNGKALEWLWMRALKAHVRGGRLVLDEPTDLPEGSEVELVAVDEDFDPAERARLDAALERSMAQAKAGQLIDADAVIEKLLARR